MRIFILVRRFHMVFHLGSSHQCLAKFDPAFFLQVPTPQPMVSPSSSSTKSMIRTPSPSPILVLPPPPPNRGLYIYNQFASPTHSPLKSWSILKLLDCSSLTCTAPLTYAPVGSPCGCVWPVEVSLRLSVTLYTFFPLVSELAKEISASLLLNRSQVRIMGANAANQQLEKTIVLINLVPKDEHFDANTAFSIYRKFWKREIIVQTSLFGLYEVLYVRYPGNYQYQSFPSIITSKFTHTDGIQHSI